MSCPELDTVVDAALAAGALGARMTGAGFGGSAIVLCRAAEARQVVEQVYRELRGVRVSRAGGLVGHPGGRG